MDNDPVVEVLAHVPVNDNPEHVNPTILKVDARLIIILLMVELVGIIEIVNDVADPKDWGVKDDVIVNTDANRLATVVILFWA